MFETPSTLVEEQPPGPTISESGAVGSVADPSTQTGGLIKALKNSTEAAAVSERAQEKAVAARTNPSFASGLDAGINSGLAMRKARATAAGEEATPSLVEGWVHNAKNAFKSGTSFASDIFS